MADPIEDPKGTADAAGAKGSDPGDNSGDGDLGALKLDDKQQAHFESVLEKRLERAKESWQKQAEAEAEKAKKAAEEARLAESQEFQQLANRRQQTIEEQSQEIATLSERAALTDKYEKALSAYRDRQIEGVPDHIKTLLKGMDVVDQMTWLTENAEQLQPQGEGDKRYVGPPPAPGSKGANGQVSDAEKRRKAWRPNL